MDITIQPRKLSGQVQIIPSKSLAHRYLICAAFADRPTDLICPEISQDIEATVDCLNALGAEIRRTRTGYAVFPLVSSRSHAVLNCRESGSTLRFLLPIAGALGADILFKTEGRLSRRPLSPLWEEMQRMGCTLQWISEQELRVCGRLRPGDYYIDGGVSSQFITGLLFAAALLDGYSTIHITGIPESKPYIDMTQMAMARFGMDTRNFSIRGGQTFRSPGSITVEGDWSNGAFWITANALDSQVQILGLDDESCQGDREIVRLLPLLKKEMPRISCEDIPDLVPILSVAAAIRQGAEFIGIRRLRLKESDRVHAVTTMLHALGGKAEAAEDTLTVYGTGLRGGTVDAMNDHRIAMAAAIAATVCQESVTILGAECIQKSYPRFWEEYDRLSQNSAEIHDCHTSLRTGSQ